MQEGRGSGAGHSKDTGRATGLEFYLLIFLNLKIGILTLVWTLYPAQSLLQLPGSPAGTKGTA